MSIFWSNTSNQVVFLSIILWQNYGNASKTWCFWEKKEDAFYTQLVKSKKITWNTDLLCLSSMSKLTGADFQFSTFSIFNGFLKFKNQSQSLKWSALTYCIKNESEMSSHRFLLLSHPPSDYSSQVNLTALLRLVCLLIVLSFRIQQCN